MAFTNNIINSLAMGLFCISTFANATAFLPLATHDQNPLLISYWIPHSIVPTGSKHVQITNSLFITNTLHIENTVNEKLIIDGEIYRFDINLQYEKNQWVYHLQIPLLASSGGFLDDIIINWHDAFNLPQGHRLTTANDQINLQYSVNEQQIIQSQQVFNGLGDISLAAVRPIYLNSNNVWHIGLGLNIPSGESNEFISNQGLDSAFWLSYLPTNKPLLFTLGIIKPHNAGLFEGHLQSSVLFIQTGFEIPFSASFKGQLQLDYHSAFINTKTQALGQSLQIQIGLHIKQNKQSSLQLFFSEDILVNSAPDISFGLQYNWLL